MCKIDDEKVLETGKEYDPLDAASMLKMMMDQQKDHFWRDQRVEITKILLQRSDLRPDVSAGQVVDMADKIVEQLKSYGD